MKYLGSWDQKAFLKNLHEYHVFVLPSFGEGIPLAVMEAMASGRALICSDVPGCNSCIIDNKNLMNEIFKLTESKSNTGMKYYGPYNGRKVKKFLGGGKLNQ